MAEANQEWSPHRECAFYTHAEIRLPEGLSIGNAIARLLQEGIIGDEISPGEDEHKVKSWDVPVGGLPVRLNSTQDGRITAWAHRSRFGPRDMTFEKLVCGMREKIAGAQIQIYS